MASHDLSNTETTILGATPGAIPGIHGKPDERFSFAPSIVGAFLQELGWSPISQCFPLREHAKRRCDTPLQKPEKGYLSDTCVIPYENKENALVAHDCGYPLSRYTCRATRVAADFLDFKAFCRCSSGVAPHPLKILVSHLSPPPIPGRCRTEIRV